MEYNYRRKIIHIRKLKKRCKMYRYLSCNKNVVCSIKFTNCNNIFFGCNNVMYNKICLNKGNIKLLKNKNKTFINQHTFLNAAIFKSMSM